MVAEVQEVSWKGSWGLQQPWGAMVAWGGLGQGAVGVVVEGWEAQLLASSLSLQMDVEITLPHAKCKI